MNIVFMGTPEFAVPTLKKLIKCHTVVAVVTQPDRPKGRNKKMLPPPIKILAAEHNIPVIQPVKVRQYTEELKKYNPDVIVVVAFGQILSQEILDIPKYGCINVHGSLLPKYRGAAPIQWSIINGETITGITTMFMSEGLDKGDMLLKHELSIQDDDTYGTLYNKLADKGAELLIETLTQLEIKQLNPQKQDDGLSTYAPMITNETGKIDWNKSSILIVNFIRGLNPSPGAYTFYKDNTYLKILKAENIKKNYENVLVSQVADIVKNKGFVVKASESAVLVTEVQAKGGKRMSALDYMRGHCIEIGDMLT